MSWLAVVPVRGSSHEFPANRINAFIRELGLEAQDLVLRSDQEPALQDLLAEVGRRRVPASASNGVAERGVQTVEGQIRVLKDAFETRVWTPIPSNHSILAWLVEFARTVINRYEVGRDGKTPFERFRGKQSRSIGLEFGEKVNFRRAAVGARMPKLVSLWSDGVFLGVSLHQWRNRCWNRERRVQDADSPTQGIRTPLEQGERGHGWMSAMESFAQ